MVNMENNFNENVIISLTSYSLRLSTLPRVINSIIGQTHKPYKIVLTLYKDDEKHIPSELKAMIDNNIIELIICDLDLRPHIKYFYVMKKYRDNPIITIDDDVIYPNDLIESLLNSYKKYPNCISARRVHKVKYKENGEIDLTKYWKLENKDILGPSFDITASGVGGILYPPNILNITDECLMDIKRYITVDDKYLYYLERKNGIKIVYVPNNMNHPTPISELKKTGLCVRENEKGEITKNDIAIIELINNRLILHNE